MTKKLGFSLVGLSILLTAGFIYFFNQNREASLTEGFIRLKVGETTVIAEVADSLQETQKGLSGRKSLAESTGMYFVLPKKDTATFWMKDMLFSLDIVWINDSKIVGVVRNAAQPSGDQIPTFTSPTPVTAALEVNSGFVDKHNLKIGDTVTTITDN